MGEEINNRQRLFKIVTQAEEIGDDQILKNKLRLILNFLVLNLDGNKLISVKDHCELIKKSMNVEHYPDVFKQGMQLRRDANGNSYFRSSELQEMIIEIEHLLHIN